jgi:hypothetical protein
LAAGAGELGDSRLTGRAGHDVQVGTEHARREHDVDVGGVLAGGDDEAAGAPYADLLEHLVLGRVTHQCQVSALRRVPDRGLVGVHDHEGGPRPVELQRGLLAHPAHPGHDHVPRELPDSTHHSTPPHGIGQADADQVFHDDTQRVEHAADAGDGEPHREEAAGGGERLDLAVTDGGDRGHGHEQGVHPRPAHVEPQDVIAGGADHDDDDDEGQRQQEPHPEGPHRRVQHHRRYASIAARWYGRMQAA